MRSAAFSSSGATVRVALPVSVKPIGTAVTRSTQLRLAYSSTELKVNSQHDQTLAWITSASAAKLGSTS